MRPRIRSNRTLYCGVWFQSAYEARRYGQLQLLERAGEIKDLKLQVPFILQPAFVAGDGTQHRKISYVADFVYTECRSGDEVVDDAKGFRTEMFKLKKKLFLFKYPNYRFIES